MARGDFAAAHEANRHALEINPESDYALADLAALQVLEGNAAAAVGTLRKVDAGGIRLSLLAIAEHTLGHAQKSQQALDEAIGTHAQDAAYQIAEAYAWRGQKDKAIEWLERAYR